jgi:hypothetical protein
MTELRLHPHLEHVDSIEGQGERATDQTVEPAFDAEQVAAAVAAVIAGVSESSWWRLHAANKTPRPNKLGGRTLWQVNGPNGLREWIRQGCPSRGEFEARQKAKENGRA